MPIYEFRCMGCGELFELLLRPGEVLGGVNCPHCGGQNAERVLSRVSHTVGSGTGPGAEITTNSCSSGSCGSMTLPGHTR